MNPRYQLVTWHGATRGLADFDELPDAQTAMAEFAARYADTPFCWDVHASIWDRQESWTVASWKPVRATLPKTNPFDIFAKLIARGDRVSVIGDRGRVDFGREEAA